MRFRRTVGAVLILLGVPVLCLGHGVSYEVFDVGTGIKATYSDDSAMSYCDVSVFAPDDAEVEYQTGITDRNGCFAFVPDASGIWRVTVDDGMGHLVTAEISVDSLGVESLTAPRGPDRLSSLIIGISVIFGIFGIFALLRGSRRTSASAEAERVDN